MLSRQIVFMVTVALTVAGGIAATSIILFGDTKRSSGQRTVADKFAQIALLGAANRFAAGTTLISKQTKRRIS